VYKQLEGQLRKNLLGKLITAQSWLSGKEVKHKTYWGLKRYIQVQWNYEQTFYA